MRNNASRSRIALLHWIILIVYPVRSVESSLARMRKCDGEIRVHPAGLKMVAQAFSDETEDSPPLAASAEVFRAQALTSTVRHAASSDLLP